MSSAKDFSTASNTAVTVVRASDASLELSLSSYHTTKFIAYGSGFGECTLSNGILYFDAWNTFLGSWTSARLYIGQKKFRIWFTVEDKPVAFFEGDVTGRGTFVGEGKSWWQ